MENGVSSTSDEATIGPCALLVGRPGSEGAFVDSHIHGKATGGGPFAVVPGGCVDAT